MYINLFLIPFITLLGLVLSYHETEKKRQIFIIVCSVVLLFIAAMRSPEYMTYRYGIDSLNYKGMFENVCSMSWDEIWLSIYQRYWMNEGEWDAGFTLLNKFIGLFTQEFHIYSLIADLIFFVPFGILLFRYSSRIVQSMFAFVFYIALIQVFLFSGARQMFAVGFDIMALLAIIDRSNVKSLLFFALGCAIHFSSIIFLIPLIMIWYDFKPGTLKLVHLVSFIVFPFILAFPNQVIAYMGETVGMEKYAEYGESSIQGGAATFIFLIEMLSLFCLVAISGEDMKKNGGIKLFYTMAPLFTLFAPLIRSNGSMIRISLYFHIFLALLVPFGIDCMINQRNRIGVYTIVLSILSYLTLANGGMTYLFYWQM